MGISYTLELQSAGASVRSVATVCGTTLGTTSKLDRATPERWTLAGGGAIWATVMDVSDERRAIAQEERDITPDVAVVFGLHSAVLARGLDDVLAVVTALFHAFGGTAVLLFMGERPVLRRRGGRVEADERFGPLSAEVVHASLPHAVRVAFPAEW
jgi:hypothetical protein